MLRSEVFEVPIEYLYPTAETGAIVLPCIEFLYRESHLRRRAFFFVAKKANSVVDRKLTIALFGLDRVGWA